MLYKNYTEEMLRFKDVIITSVERRDTVLYLQIKMYQRIHKCPRCGESTSKVHDYRNQSIKDISAFGSKTIIHYRKRLYVCPSCNKRFYEQAPFLLAARFYFLQPVCDRT